MMHEDEFAEGRKYHGKYKGFVRRNDDPEKRGRIICYCPQVMGPVDDVTHWLHWAEPCFPWLGGINTLDFGPPYTKEENGGVEVGVWLEFEGGNADFPIWVGTWIPAETTASDFAQQDLTAAEATTGGSIFTNPPAGSDLDAIKNLKPIKGEHEARFLTKKGRDIIIGSAQGGYMLLGPSGVHVVGAQITLNGRLMDADASDSVVG